MSEQDLCGTLTLGSFTFNLDELIASMKRMDSDGQETMGFLLSLAALRAQKGADYGTRRDTYQNYQIVADLKGVPGWHVAADRLVEKGIRLGNLVGKDLAGDKPAAESIDDTLRDMALIAAIVWAMRARDEAAAFRPDIVVVKQPQSIAGPDDTGTGGLT